MSVNAFSDEYSSFNPIILEEKGRIVIGKQILSLIKTHLKPVRTNNLKLLDLGCASGVITNLFADKFKTVIGVDVDKKAISMARDRFKKKNLKFLVRSALETEYPDNYFDVVVANQLYYCFKKPEQFFDEIFRILKPGGICFLGGRNKYTLWDTQFELPILSFLPKSLADYLVVLFKRGDSFGVSYRSYWDLEKITNKFLVKKYTPAIMNNPKKYGYNRLAKYQWFLSKIPLCLWKKIEPILPNFIWVLQKP